MDDLKERMRNVRVPPPDLERVVRRSRRLRRGRILTAAVVGVVAIAGIAVPLTMLSRTHPERSVLVVTTNEVTEDGVTLDVPREWFLGREPSGRTERPTALLLAGTWEVRTAGACQIDPPRDGAFVSIAEFRTGPPAKPSRFPPRRAGALTDARRRGAYGEAGCAAGENVNGDVWWLRDGGRYFEVTVGYTRGASAATIERARSVADSLRVDPLPPEECAYWSHPACPESQWLQLVIQEGGGTVEGDTLSSYVVRTGPHRFYLWAFEAPPESGSRPNDGMELIGEIANVQVRADHLRGMWEVNGMIVWFESGPRGEPRPGIDILERLVRASLDVPYPPELFEP